MEENLEFFALPVEITENSLGDKKVIARGMFHLDNVHGYSTYNLFIFFEQ